MPISKECGGIEFLVDPTSVNPNLKDNGLILFIIINGDTVGTIFHPCLSKYTFLELDSYKSITFAPLKPTATPPNNLLSLFVKENSGATDTSNDLTSLFVTSPILSIYDTGNALMPNDELNDIYPPIFVFSLNIAPYKPTGELGVYWYPIAPVCACEFCVNNKNSVSSKEIIVFIMCFILN